MYNRDVDNGEKSKSYDETGLKCYDEPGLDKYNVDRINDYDEIRIGNPDEARIIEEMEIPNPIDEKNKAYCTIALIVANVLIYLICKQYKTYIWTGGANYDYIVGNGEYGRILSAMFLHASPVHLMSNMVALFIFGMNVEGRLGSKRFTIIYFVSGIIASASVIFTSLLNQGKLVFSVGASGAIYGIMVAELFLDNRNNGKKNGLAEAIGMAAAFALIDVVVVKSVTIDVFAHIIGGIVGGVATAIILKIDSENNPGIVNNQERKVAKILSVIICLIMAVIATFEANLGGKPELLPSIMVECISEANYKGESDITYKEAFDAYFTNPEWNAYKSSNDENVITFTGQGDYYGKVSDIRMEFKLDTEKNVFTYDCMYVNGTKINNAEMSAFIRQVFDAY